MAQISSSKAAQKALVANVAMIEVCMGLTVVGLNIGGRIVRHSGTGWYDEAQVDEAVSAATQAA